MVKDASEWLSVKLQPKGRRSHMVGRASRLRPTGADIIDMLTMHPDARRQVVRVLGEQAAGENRT
jgi:hypothetical protein